MYQGTDYLVAFLGVPGQGLLGVLLQHLVDANGQARAADQAFCGRA